MKQRFISVMFFVVAFLLVTNFALATNHTSRPEDISEYIKGTIKSVDRNSITITTTDEDIVKKVTEYNSEHNVISKNTEEKATQKKKPASGKARITQMMNEKRAAKIAAKKVRQEKKAEKTQTAATAKTLSEDKKEKVAVKVIINPAQLERGLYTQGAKVLIKGNYESARNVIIAREVLNKDGQLIKKNR